MTRSNAYPYAPRSNARLLPGEIWAIPLANGRFAAGVVIGVAGGASAPLLLTPSNRAFVGGLLDWQGDGPPAPDDVPRTRVLEQGVVHIKTITETGGEIIGRADGIDALEWRSGPGQDGGWVYRGVERVRPATAKDDGIPMIRAFGYGYLREMAEQRAGLRRIRERPAPGR